MHPTEQEVVDYVFGDLAPDRLEEIAELARDDRELAAMIEILRGFCLDDNLADTGFSWHSVVGESEWSKPGAERNWPAEVRANEETFARATSSLSERVFAFAFRAACRVPGVGAVARALELTRVHRMANNATRSLQRGHIANALAWSRGALYQARWRFGDDHPEATYFLYCLGNAYLVGGQHEVAAYYFEVAVDRLIQLHDGEHYARRSMLVDGAYVAGLKRDYPRAESLLQWAITDVEQCSCAEDDPDYSLLLVQQVFFLCRAGRQTEALQAMRRCADSIEHLIQMGSWISSRRCRLEVARLLETSVYLYCMAGMEYFLKERQIITKGFELTIRLQALSSQSNVHDRYAQLGRRHHKWRKEIKTIARLRNRIGRRAFHGKIGKTAISEMRNPLRAGENRRHKLVSLRFQEERIEAVLSSHVQDITKSRERGLYSIESITSRLLEDTAIVQFVRIDPDLAKVVPVKAIDRYRKGRYVAYVTFGGPAKEVWLIDLDDAATIERTVAGMSEAAHAGQDEQSRAARRVYEATLQKLSSCMEGRRKLLVAGDGVLSSVKFQELPQNGKTRVGETYEIRYIRGTHDLVAA